MKALLPLLVVGVLMNADVAHGQTSGTQSIQVGRRMQATFTTDLPINQDGKPYIDYVLNITSAGRYSIELDSANTDVYDPYIVLLQNGAMIGEDDDGGKGVLQSRLTLDLQPGTYTIRVTRFGGGQLRSATQFELSVSRER